MGHTSKQFLVAADQERYADCPQGIIVFRYSVFLAFRLAFQNYDRTHPFIDRKVIVFKASARTNRLRLLPK